MTNRQISKAFKLTSQLMELHGENAFKIRSMQNAAFRIDRLSQQLVSMDKEEISSIDGLGKGTQEKINSLIEKESFPELEQLLAKTPPGIVEVLSIKGLGPKKVSVLWHDLGIESVGELLYACNENRLSSLKGFGQKTQDQIRSAIEFRQSGAGKHHYAAIEATAIKLLNDIKDSGIVSNASFTGEMRRCSEIVNSLDILVENSDSDAFKKFLNAHSLIDDNSISERKVEYNGSNYSALTATIGETLTTTLILSKNFERDLFITTCSPKHFEILTTRYGLKVEKISGSEQTIYEKLKLPFFEPELREGLIEFDLAEGKEIPELITIKDLKGILHNHTTFSDGADTVEVMAQYCMELGFEYLGISDHSQTAFYANGLKPERILQQHQLIDELNKKLSPFKIFKGIESDILPDGSLDYTEDILGTFDFIVASIHGNLRMEEAKATARLIKAIENPYTTILGHPTGRLLLSRPGYPIDHMKVIDACAANGVIIELNSNPYRLDMDWRYIQYALSKDVMISINPDAHRKEGYHDMHFGVLAARKGGLTKEMTFNALPLKKIAEHFKKKR